METKKPLKSKITNKIATTKSTSNFSLALQKAQSRIRMLSFFSIWFDTAATKGASINIRPNASDSPKNSKWKILFQIPSQTNLLVLSNYLYNEKNNKYIKKLIIRPIKSHPIFVGCQQKNNRRIHELVTYFSSYCIPSLQR